MRLHQPQKLAGKRNAGTTWLRLALIAVVAMLSVASPQTHAQIGGVVSDTLGILILVTTLDDHDDGACDDDCTLREAIDYANARSGHDGIRSGVTGTINLQSALPPIFDDLTITGPGADLLTVRRDTGGDYRIFTVTAAGTVTLANMTILNGFPRCHSPVGI